MLIDTHCHIHEAGYPLDVGDALARAHHAGVSRLICAGTNNTTSQEALHFAQNHENVWASVGVHPHDSKEGWENIPKLLRSESAQHALQGEGQPPPEKIVVAIGEIGLDYFYAHSPRDVQITALEAQLQLAVDYHLPVIFHVREAFADFWPIFDNFSNIRGVLHSFTDTKKSLGQALDRGLFIGINGISTFTRDEAQKVMFDSIPLEKLLFETDAPFLTPPPYRGKVNEPAYVRVIAEYHAKRRTISLEELAAATTTNATALFAL